MDTQALRVTYFVDDEHVPPWCDDIRSFLGVALGLRFEMRYFGEECWYMTTAEDLAHTLVPYYPDLTVCLDDMLDGEEIDSRLATYRLCRDQRGAHDFTLRGADHGSDHSPREDRKGD